MVESAAHKYPVVDLDEFERRLRGPALPPRVEADPLAELARLVNGDNARDQHGGRGDLFASQPAPQHSAPVVRLPVASWDRIEPAMEAPAPVLRPSLDPHAAEQLSVQEVFAREMAALHGAEQHTAYSGHQHQTPANDRGLPAEAGYDQAAGHHSGDGHDHATDEVQWQPRSAPATARKSNRPFYLMGAIALTGLLGIGGTFAMRSNANTAAGKVAPTIKAAETPVKVVPDAPGGTVVPNQNASILDKTTGAKPVGNVSATKVVASVEQPIDLGQVAKPAASPPVRAATTAVAPPAPDIGPSTGTVQDPRAGLPAPGQGSIFGEPKRVKTVSVKPNGELISESAAPLAAPPPPVARPLIAGVPVTAPSAAPATPVAPVAKPVAPKTTVRIVPVAKPAAPKPAAKPEAAAEAPAATDANAPLQLRSAGAKANANRIKLAKAAVANETAPAAAGGGNFSVQLAAPPSEAEAKDKLSRLQKNYGEALAGHALSIREASSNGKTVFRIRANNLSRDDAKTLCDKLAAAGGKCFIAGN